MKFILSCLFLFWAIPSMASMVILAKGRNAIISTKELENLKPYTTYYVVRNKKVVAKILISKIIADGKKALVKVQEGSVRVGDGVYSNFEDYLDMEKRMKERKAELEERKWIKEEEKFGLDIAEAGIQFGMGYNLSYAFNSEASGESSINGGLNIEFSYLKFLEGRNHFWRFFYNSYSETEEALESGLLASGNAEEVYNMFGAGFNYVYGKFFIEILAGVTTYAATGKITSVSESLNNADLSVAGYGAFAGGGAGLYMIFGRWLLTLKLDYKFNALLYTEYTLAGDDYLDQLESKTEFLQLFTASSALTYLF